MKRNFICYNGCPFILDAYCVEYTGEVLDNLINASPEDRLDAILQTIDNITFTQTPFSANATNSIYAVGGGILGHSPHYHVRLDPSESNLIVLTDQGLLVLINEGGDGKVKVDSDDDKDYLENQFAQADDGIVIMTVTPVKEAGKIKFQPSIDAEALLQQINITYIDEFCEIISDCIPHSVDGFTTTTTTTSTTTSTSTTSTSTTTTTTQAVAYGSVNIQACLDPDLSMDAITFNSIAVTPISGSFPLTASNPNMIFAFPTTGSYNMVISTTGTIPPTSITVVDSMATILCDNINSGTHTFAITVNTSVPVSIEFDCVDNC